MKKLSRIIRLMNLLDHKVSIPLKRIQEECDVHERTAFRYLNALKDADIPVYFDSKTNGYRLYSQHSYAVETLQDQELALLIIALTRLIHDADGGYKSQLRNLLRKLEIRCPGQFEDLAAIAEHVFAERREESGVDSRITEILIQMATKSRCELVVLSRLPRQSVPREHCLREPALLFSHGWYLVESSDAESARISLEDIVSVRLKRIPS